MKILLVSATVFEISPFLDYLEKNYQKVSFFEYKSEKHTIFPLISGVGMVNTTSALCRFGRIKEIDVVINAGIAGAFDTSIPLGKVLEISSDRFGDLGVENADGSFTDVFEMELIEANQFPYVDGWINNDKLLLSLGLDFAKAITVNKVHGTAIAINAIVEKYHADVETMEGAAFFYVCKMMDVKFHQIRAISNYVEVRNRENWKIDLAIEKLNEQLLTLMG